MLSPVRAKSFRVETFVDVAFTGKTYSYTYLAGKSFFSTYTNNAELHSVGTVQQMFKDIAEGKVHYGITPLESSSYGTIHDVYDRLLQSQGQFRIVGEIGQIEQHCLCVSSTFSGANDLDIEKIASHPHIMECCSDFLDSIDTRRESLGKAPMVREPVWDSIAGCKEATKSTEVITACICSKEAAEHYKLKILATGIGNFQNAETRYIVVAKADPEGGVSDPLFVTSRPREGAGSGRKRAKCSIALALANIPGAIFKMSSCFAFRNIDIIKIESRPATVSIQLNLPAEKRPFTQKHWDLIFYIDYEPSENEELNESMRANLSEYCLWIRELGCYQAGLHSLDQKPAEWNAIVDVVGF